VDALAGRHSGRPVMGGIWGSARAAARRAPQGAKAELPVRLRREARRRLRPLAESSPSHRPPRRASSRKISAPSGARRAPRALEWVCKESPHRGERWQRVLRRVMCDTHPPADVRQRHAETTAGSSSACFAERLGTYPHRAATGRSGFPGADDRGSNAEIINSVTSRWASNRPWGPWSALLR
jgi:hypothetical protein